MLLDGHDREWSASNPLAEGPRTIESVARLAARNGRPKRERSAAIGRRIKNRSRAVSPRSVGGGMNRFVDH
ncbi:hypothetical protein BRC68_15605 [Halobacteriales archaeon QH_6_64_20]|nr:MAG: hypothetical protein BRC68_15605 [Halobacteriales archaeon QH_6_64_20]